MSPATCSALIWRLPPAATLEEADDPLADEAAPGRKIALAGDRLVRPDGDRLDRDGADCGGLGPGQVEGAGELGQKGMFGGHGVHAG
ncbi:hypothetical protein J2Z33_002156 [Rubellimicrobium aerolatum]|nr:hypothetical protein [Rubellimicrobium aerolatum]